MKQQQNKIAPEDEIPEKGSSEIEKAVPTVPEATEQTTCNGAMDCRERQKRERDELFRKVTEAFSDLYEDAQRIAFGKEVKGDFSLGGELAMLAKKTEPLVWHNPHPLVLQIIGEDPYFYPLPLQEFSETFAMLRDLARWRGGEEGRQLRLVTKMTAELSAWCQARGFPFDNEPEHLKRMLARRLAEKSKVCAAVGYSMMTKQRGVECGLQDMAEALWESQVKLQEALAAAARAEKLRMEAQDNAEKSEELRKEAQATAEKAEQKLAESEETLRKGLEAVQTAVEQTGEKVDGFSEAFKKMPGALRTILIPKKNYPQEMLDEAVLQYESHPNYGDKQCIDWKPLLKKYHYDPHAKNAERNFVRALQRYLQKRQ